MLVIRLRRIGRKHDPHYRLVVTEHTAPVQGKFLTEVGHYHPKSKQLVIVKEAFLSWLDKGAKPSNTVSKLAKRQGIDHKLVVVKERHGKPKKGPKEAQVEPKVKPTETDAPAVEAEEKEVSEPEISEETSSDEGTQEQSVETETPSEPSSEEPRPKAKEKDDRSAV